MLQLLVNKSLAEAGNAPTLFYQVEGVGAPDMMIHGVGARMDFVAQLGTLGM